MDEIIFFTEKNEQGRYIAREKETNITQEANTIQELREHIKSFYRELSRPILVRLYFIKDRYDLTFYTSAPERLEHCL